MDNEENQNNSGQPSEEQGNGVFQNHSGLKTLAGVAGIAVFLLAAIALRNNYLDGRLQGTGADASCYGYNCQPSVIIGGRGYTGNYNSNPFSYGTLTVYRGQPIELTWYGTNVDRCSAKWTGFEGTYYPPTVYEARITTQQNFSVTCSNGRNKVTSNLVVQVGRGSPTDVDPSPAAGTSSLR
ncbi:hypothetical protein IPM19_04940 [bacterium]|nr:MAG: hypothetical protein IPM19_04940 [bacterium]